MIWLSNYAFDNGVAFIQDATLPPSYSSRYLVDNNLIILNLNSCPRELLPFQFAHELGHALCEDARTMYKQSNTSKLKCEAFADNFAEALLRRYCCKTGIDYNTIPTPCKMS